MRHVYLDHQSTTPMAPEVREAMAPYFTEIFGNPASLHQHGLAARDALAKARGQIATFINAESPEDILFTSGGTESANLAVKGAAYANRRRGHHIVLTEIEHPAVLNSVDFLEKQGFTSTKVKVDACGRVDPEALRAAITDQTILICVHHVNHEIGVIESIAELANMANEKGITFFSDATASGGWLPVDVQALGVQMLSLSPHRFYGPKGIGVLYRNRRARLVGMMHGGAQEGGRRAGTENAPAIVGAGVACDLARMAFPHRTAHLAKLQESLWKGLQAKVPYIRLNGPALGAQRIATNLNVSTEFIEGEAQVLRCDVQGIAVASGSSCVSKSLKVSHVLAAIGLDHALAQSSLIFSLGQGNTEEEIAYVVETFAKIATLLRSMSPLWDEFQRGLIPSLIQPRS